MWLKKENLVEQQKPLMEDLNVIHAEGNVIKDSNFTRMFLGL